MTQEELIKEIRQLPLEQQERILHAITTSVRDQAPPREKRSGIASRLRGIAKPDIDPARNAPTSGNGSSLSQMLYGILQFEGAPPNDGEVNDMIADYLLKKYY